MGGARGYQPSTEPGYAAFGDVVSGAGIEPATS